MFSYSNHDELVVGIDVQHLSANAMSVEAFIDGEMAGGLYGVAVGKVFCGESMFTVKENGSKVALILFAIHKKIWYLWMN